MEKGRKGERGRSKRSKFGRQPKETPDPVLTAAFPSSRSGARENSTFFFFLMFHPQLFAAVHRNSDECLTRSPDI